MTIMMTPESLDIDCIENLEDIRARFEASFNQVTPAEQAAMVDDILKREFGHLKVANNADFRRRVLSALQENDVVMQPTEPEVVH